MPATNEVLGQGNVFTRMCHSVNWGMGSLYNVTSSLATRPYVPSRKVSVSGSMFLLWGLCQGDPWTETLLTETTQKRPPEQRPPSPGQRRPLTETLLWTETPLNRDPPGQSPPQTVKSGQYISYWNAFF